MEQNYQLAEVGSVVANHDDPEIAARVKYLHEKQELAFKMGLSRQHALVSDEIERLTKPHLSIDPMDPDEILIWQAFLPTSYNGYPTKDKNGYYSFTNHGNYSISSYHFDKIPYPVLQKLYGCMEAELYDRYEIWTPEIPVPDPMLVGIRGEKTYMIARWAESDSNLVTINTVKTMLARRWLSESSMLPLLLISLTILSFLFTLGLFNLQMPYDLASFKMVVTRWLLMAAFMLIPAAIWLYAEATANRTMSAVIRHTRKHWRTRDI